MKFTNSYGLPQPLVNALISDSYDLLECPANIYSVTTSIAPPKIKVLERRRKDEIEVDASDRLWVLLGQAVHYVTEQSADDTHLAEERWFLDVEEDQVYTVGPGVLFWQTENYKTDHHYISGKLDLYDTVNHILRDYKLTSVWSWTIEKKIKPEHEAQLNMNAYAMRKLGFPVEKLSIMMLFRDWSATKALSDYPDLPVPMKEIDSPVWSMEQCREYINTRVSLFVACEAMKDDDIPECSPEERWAKSGTWAVKKVGNKKALKVYDVPVTPEMLATHGKDAYVEERPGNDTRCTGYCAVNFKCHYYRNKYGVVDTTDL